MSTLGTILRELVGGAEVDRPASRRLSSGLTVAVRLTPEGLHCLSLTRTHSAGPSRKEAETCADHLSWLGAKIASSTTRDGRPCLLVWQGPPPAPVRPKPQRDRPLSTRVDTKQVREAARKAEAARKTLEEAERQRHIGALVFCAAAHGLRSAWFRREAAQNARQSYLRGLSLEELREERRSRYGRWQLRIAVQLALRIARWRLTFRALPWPAVSA